MALREIIARFGFQVDGSGLKKAQTGIGGVVGSLRTFAGVVAGSAIVRGLNSFVKDVVKTGDQLGKTSAQLGVGVGALQRWQRAAEFSGASQQEFNTGLRTLAKNALLAQQGSKQASTAFGDLGVDIQDANGNFKDTETLLRETGLALGEVENSTERVALAQQLLGRSGTKLLPLFAKTGDELDKLLGRVDELGGGFSEQAVKLSEETADAFKDLEIATDSLKSQIAVSLLPGVRDATRQFAEWLGGILNNQEAVATLKNSAKALGVALGAAAFVKFGGALAALAKSAALPLLKFLLLFLVVDDLVALFEGRGSVIGDFLDDLFGEGSAKNLVKEIKSVGSAVLDLIGNLDEVDVDARGFVSDNESRFTKLASSIASSTDQIAKDFAEAWEFAKKDANEALIGIGKAIAETGEFLKKDMVALGTAVKNGIVNAITGAGSAIKGAVVGVLTTIKTAAKDFLQGGIDLAKALLDGFVNGIKAGAKAALTTVTNLGKTIVTATKQVFKSKSPSEVFADIGRDNVMGLVKGMQAQSRATLPGVAASVSQAVPTRTGGGASALAGLTARGGVVFKSDIALTVNGGSASDPQIQKLRQGVRSELRDNRRATMEALIQTVEIPA